MRIKVMVRKLTGAETGDGLVDCAVVDHDICITDGADDD
jgi:hypothetical protein